MFADASTKVHGAVAFLSNINVSSFVIAKGCIAPLKQITLPKLELMAVITAAKLVRFVINSLQLKAMVTIWTDSQIVLCWIQSTKTLPQFIKHRVEDIKRLIRNTIWQFCLSSDTSSPEGSPLNSFTLHPCGGHHGTHSQH